MQKKGQFYLVAAIVIISIAAGFIAISNSVSSQPVQGVYYLRDEIKIESSKVIDYANYNGLSSAELKGKLTDLYSRYTSSYPEDNFYFIFGDAGTMTFMAYQSFDSDVALDGVDKTEEIGTGEIYTEDFDPGGNVTIGINENNYIFKLNIGENFGFVASSKSEGQVYTAVG